MTSPSIPPPPRRVVTSYNPDLTLQVLDDELPLKAVDTMFLAQAFVQDAFEINPLEAIKGASAERSIKPGGVNVSYLDIAPHTEVPMHFTDTIDYTLVLFGTVEMGLTGGVVKTLSQGDLVVQLGVEHSWVNKTDEWARVIGIMLSTPPIVVDGKTLDKGPLKATPL